MLFAAGTISVRVQVKPRFWLWVRGPEQGPERGAEYATCGRPFTLCRYKTHTLASELLRYTALSLLLPSLQAALPSVPPDTKLSKLDVLVLATNYIAHLTETLDQGGMLTEHTTSRPATTTWVCECAKKSKNKLKPLKCFI
uniref:BHLH domain-containing protein n=1 Tax=Neolamprologus brichardi TaxID=32507 RepID=A0A3Q4H292_NEOBR